MINNIIIGLLKMQIVACVSKLLFHRGGGCNEEYSGIFLRYFCLDWAQRVLCYVCPLQWLGLS